MADPTKDPVAGSATNATQSDSGTGASQADVAAGYRSSGADVTSDVGQAEAYILQLKRLVASELDLDSFVRSNSQRLIRNGEDADQIHRSQSTRAIEQALQLQAKLNDQYLAYSAGLQATAISERERTVRVGDIANNNMWASDSAFDTVVETVVAKTLSKLGVKPAA